MLGAGGSPSAMSGCPLAVWWRWSTDWGAGKRAGAPWASLCEDGGGGGQQGRLAAGGVLHTAPSPAGLGAAAWACPLPRAPRPLCVPVWQQWGRGLQKRTRAQSWARGHGMAPPRGGPRRWTLRGRRHHTNKRGARPCTTDLTAEHKGSSGWSELQAHHPWGRGPGSLDRPCTAPSTAQCAGWHVSCWDCVRFVTWSM